MSKISTIWDALQARLQTLVDSHDIGCIINDDFKVDVLSQDIPSFPAAIITTPSFNSTVDTSGENKRTYDFQILVVLKGEDNQDAQSVANLQETITDLFDSDPTLKGKNDQALATFLQPATSQALTLNTNDQTYIIFTISVKIEMYVTINFN
jgi:hypothetical protein